MIRACIFDYDGLLVDSEHWWLRARLKILARYDIVIPESGYEDLLRPRVWEYLVDRFKLPLPAETLREESQRISAEMMPNGIQPMPGARSLLKRLHGRYPLAIGSTSSSSRIRKALQSLGMETYFTTIIGGRDVEHHKPHPETFLKAADALNVSPPACLVFEDTMRGLEAAKAAGMKCIIIPNRDIGRTNFPGADAVVSSLDDVTDELIASFS